MANAPESEHDVDVADLEILPRNRVTGYGNMRPRAHCTPTSAAVESENPMNYGTLPSRLLQAVDAKPNPRAQMFRTPDRWEAISSQEFLRRVAGLSAAFTELGVKPGDRVVL